MFRSESSDEYTPEVREGLRGGVFSMSFPLVAGRPAKEELLPELLDRSANIPEEPLKPFC